MVKDSQAGLLVHSVNEESNLAEKKLITNLYENYFEIGGMFGN